MLPEESRTIATSGASSGAAHPGAGRQSLTLGLRPSFTGLLFRVGLVGPGGLRVFGPCLGRGVCGLGRRLALRRLGLTRRVRGLPRGLLRTHLELVREPCAQLRDPLPEPVLLGPCRRRGLPPDHGTRPALRPVSSAFPRSARTGPPPPPPAHPGGPARHSARGPVRDRRSGPGALAQPGVLGSLCGEQRRHSPVPRAASAKARNRRRARTVPRSIRMGRRTRASQRGAGRDHASRRRWSRYHWSRGLTGSGGGNRSPEREHRLSVHHIDRLIAGDAGACRNAAPRAASLAVPGRSSASLRSAAKRSWSKVLAFSCSLTGRAESATGLPASSVYHSMYRPSVEGCGSAKSIAVMGDRWRRIRCPAGVCGDPAPGVRRRGAGYTRRSDGARGVGDGPSARLPVGIPRPSGW